MSAKSKTSIKDKIQRNRTVDLEATRKKVEEEKRRLAEEEARKKAEAERKPSATQLAGAAMFLNHENVESVRQVDVHMDAHMDAQIPKTMKKDYHRKKRKTLYFDHKVNEMLASMAKDREQSVFMEKLIIDEYKRRKKETRKEGGSK